MIIMVRHFCVRKFRVNTVWYAISISVFQQKQSQLLYITIDLQTKCKAVLILISWLLKNPVDLNGIVFFLKN